MAELDGLEPRGNVLVVAATNRRESLDPALLRPGRLGDLVLEVPRPSMAAAPRHSRAPPAGGGALRRRRSPSDARRDVIDTVVSRLYAPNGEGELGSVVFRDGARRAILARDLVSGAVLANIARVATERACLRESKGGVPGIGRDDAVEAVAQELDRAVAALTPLNCHAHLPGLPQDLAVARVETADRPAAPRPSRTRAPRSGSHHADPQDPRRRRRAEQLHPGRVRRRRHRPDGLAPAPRRRPRRVVRRRRHRRGDRLGPQVFAGQRRLLLHRLGPPRDRAQRDPQRVRPRGALAGDAAVARRPCTRQRGLPEGLPPAGAGQLQRRPGQLLRQPRQRAADARGLGRRSSAAARTIWPSSRRSRSRASC